jgi:hypothetical protein
VLGAEHGDRVRVEGHHHDGQVTEPVADLAGPPQHVLVAEVHAVEVPDGDHGPSQRVGHLLERAPDGHGGGSSRTGCRRVAVDLLSGSAR